MKNFLNLLIVTILIGFGTTYASETVDGAKKDYENFKTEMSSQLDHVESELALLKEKAKEKSNQTQNESIQELEKTKAKLKAELNQMQQTSASGWKKFKTEFALSVDKLNSKIQKKLKN